MNNDYNQITINTILSEMQKQGVTPRELAKRSNCTSEYIRHMKMGRYKTIQVDYADRLLKALGISITIGGTNDE